MTLRFAVFGNPIAHSRSPDIHARFAKALSIQLTYERILVPFGGFIEAVHRFREAGGAGANVTLPFKLDAFQYATSLSPAAQQAGAVNTLSFRADGVTGDNTDGVGLVRDIEVNGGYVLKDKRVLVLGAGGAARGVMGPLLEARPAELAIANRTKSKAEDIAALFQAGSVDALALDAFGGRKFDVVINATSASLGQSLPQIPRSIFAKGAFAYDMVYGSATTPFLDFALERGARTRDGLGMLVEQAAEGFRLWHGVRPDTMRVLAQLRAEILAE